MTESKEIMSKDCIIETIIEAYANGALDLPMLSLYAR